MDRTLSGRPGGPSTPTGGPAGLARLRWLLLGLFAWGSLATLSPLAAFDPRVSPIFLGAGCAAAVLLAVLGRPLPDVLWVWIILLVFAVGYYLQTLMAAAYAHDPALLVARLNREWGWIDYRVLVDGLRAFTPPFVAFVLAAVVWLHVVRRREVAPLPADPIQRRLLLLLLARWPPRSRWPPSAGASASA